MNRLSIVAAQSSQTKHSFLNCHIVTQFLQNVSASLQSLVSNLAHYPVPREAWRRILLHPTAKQETSAQTGTVAPRRRLSGESAGNRHKSAKFKSQEQT